MGASTPQQEGLQKPWEIDFTVYDDEAALLEGLRRRDRMACTCLLKRYMPRLYKLALQVTGSSDEAEDVLQESFIKACGHLDSFKGQSEIGTWLYRIVLNNALMHLRRRKEGVISLSGNRGQREDGHENTTLDLPDLDTANAPDESLLSRELKEALDAAVLRLPDSLRSAFVLRDIEGLSTDEAARTLGIGESALKVRLHRARLALREALGPYVQGSRPATLPMDASQLESRVSGETR
ncbi:MAG: sigma-70 family RNA polymerase sigma factor [Chloroflexota bacterium]